MASPEAHSAARAQLRQLLAEWGVEAALLEGDQHSLIQSGALDSAGLFNLSLWIESQVGRPIDPGSIDVLQAWDRIETILAFLFGAPLHAPAVVAVTAMAAPEARWPGPDGVEYVIERYRNEDLAEVARLFTHLWSPDRALNGRVFEWKYLHNPLARDPLIYLVRHGGQVVAMRALCETQWQAQGADPSVTVYCADDLIIDPAHRNHGLYPHLNAQALRDLAARGEKFFISLSALRVARMQSLAGGARAVPIGPVLGRRSARARFADALEHVLARVPLGWRAAQPVAQAIEGRHSAAAAFARLDAAASGGPVRVSRTAPIAAMAALAARAPSDGRIRHVRDETFLRWRYAAPLHEYRVITAERNGAVAAYLVLGRALSPSANPRRVNLVDWAASDPQALGDALDLSLRVGRFAELVTWGDAPHSAWTQTLTARGFAPIDQHQTARGLPCVLVHTVDSSAAEPHIGARCVLEPAAWDLRMSYTSYA